MADVGISEMSRIELIAEIRAKQDELERFGVKRERIQFYKLKDFELPEVLDSLREQLKTRKRFLGVI